MTITAFFDTGRSSGVVFGHYSDSSPWLPLGMFQFEGGATALAKFCEPYDWSKYEVSAEKWVPYPTPGHSATLDSTYPLVCEGVLISLGLMPDEFPHSAWQRSGEQYPFEAPPGTPSGRKVAVKKKLRQNWLKEHDLWLTGKDVGQPNADDAISALSHQIVRMKKIRHMPSMELYFGSKEEQA